MHRKLFFALLLITLSASTAFGDKPVPPHSYTIVSVDHRYLFVMLAPTLESDQSFRPQEKGAEALKIRKRYATSGLYLNDGSTVPLWTVDWYATAVVLPSDGVHLIRKGPWASTSSDEALTFFASGKELKAYKVKDLVSLTSLLPHSVSHFEWEKSIELDNERLILTVTTLHYDKFEFDITTGEIRSEHRVSGAIAVVVTPLVLIILLIIVVVGKRIGTRHLRSSKVREPSRRKREEQQEGSRKSIFQA